MMEEAAISRKKKKEEGRRLKRQRIEESGGKRPRKEERVDDQRHKNETQKKQSHPNGGKNGRNTVSHHRFGRVMDKVPCRNQPRLSTVSIAIPGSVVANCQTRELKTQICGQIARAATIYHVDEIIVFDDKLSKGRNSSNYYRGRDDQTKPNDEAKHDSQQQQRQRPSDPHTFMARILQYCECPQYLRRHFFPMHPDLQFAGLLAPVDAPHHVRAGDRCPFREGVVLDKTLDTNKSLVNCGIRSRPVQIDQLLQPGIRCTVQLDPASYGRPGQIQGKVVSPSTITETDGTYWGYTVRIASSIKAIFDECPYGDKYDLTIGTSERGHESIEDRNFSLLSSGSLYRHALIVFGGVAGIEECVDADESSRLAGSKSSTMFDKWINVCPFQGSRTIRTEEAVLITLAKLSPLLAQAAIHSKSESQTVASTKTVETHEPPVAVKFSGKELSDESSDSEESSR